jgi:hypothetical protein
MRCGAIVANGHDIVTAWLLTRAGRIGIDSGMRRKALGLLTLSAGALTQLHTLPALADDSQVVVGLDGDLGIAPDGEELTGGGGGSLRLGLESDVLAILYVRPELAANYHEFGGERAPTLWRGIGGLRVGLDFLLRVGVFGHAGYGSLDSPVSDVSRKAFTYDVGAEIGLGLLPLLNLGLHFAYINIASGEAERPFDYTVFGLHVELVF